MVMLFKMVQVIILVIILLKRLVLNLRIVIILLKTPYQTSWGVSTRMIGAIIMTHGDDHGLVLPPKIAPFKTIIIPIGDVSEKLEELKSSLKNNNITFKVDERDKTPGFKFAEAEVKGYPIRIELGKEI